jgi:hypothetical protein
MRAWIAHLRAQVEDLGGAAEDATRPPGQRLLGRAAARGVIEEARWALDQLLVAGEQGAAEP